MDREINLLGYLPPVLQDVKELKVISEVENPEIVNLWAAIDNAMKDQFVQDATENGINRLEKILKIIAKGTDTLADRRFRISARLNEQLPYTFRSLKQQLANLCGADGFSLVRDLSTFTLTVRVALTAKSNFNDVATLLYRVVPQNMIVDLSLLYNQYSILKGFTHAQLSSYTHDQLRNEAIV